MDVIKTYLESSTIHGFSHISNTRRFVRFFWILVVISGFIGAFTMIYQSFNSWTDSPIKTTIETKPITEITFPKVTVCPPKNTYTDLNYDLMMTENMTLDNDTIHELLNYTLEIIDEHLYETMLTNFSRLVDNDTYYNWYHGYTEIELPFYDIDGANLVVNTAAKSGTISTQYFGDKFDLNKVETNAYFKVKVDIPLDSVRENPNVTLNFDIETVTMDLSIGEDSILLGQELIPTHTYATKMNKSFSPPGWDTYIVLKRETTHEDLTAVDMELMPGFRFSWSFTGIIEEENLSIYSEEGGDYESRTTENYVRESFRNTCIKDFI